MSAATLKPGAASLRTADSVSRRFRALGTTDRVMLAVGSGMVAVIASLAVFPGVVAPYDANRSVGPRLLGPGESPAAEVLVARAGSGIRGLGDLATADRVGVVIGTPASQNVRTEAARISAQRTAGGGAVLRLRVERFETLGEAMAALGAGTVAAVAADQQAVEAAVQRDSRVAPVGPVRAGAPPARSFSLGTNNVGQDVLSRLVAGARSALLVGLLAPALAFLIGTPLGLWSGYRGGRLDLVANTIMNSVYAFPGLIIAITIAAVLGPGLLNIVFALGVIYVPTYFRIARSRTLVVSNELYIDAARALGTPTLRVLRRHLYPNVAPAAAVFLAFSVADAILIGAGLSFLGLGLPPDVADWGRDTATGRSYMQDAWWIITFPGAAIALTALGFGLIGEALTGERKELA